jgi:hypothetical protein
MATASTESLYPPLTARLIHRSDDTDEPIALRKPIFPRRDELARDAKLFTITWGCGFVFFITFLG